jgi:hypothetical protein
MVDRPENSSRGSFMGGTDRAGSLNQITEVPVPTDPATGAPFLDRAADSAAIRRSLRVEPALWTLSYRIAIRH